MEERRAAVLADGWFDMSARVGSRVGFAVLWYATQRLGSADAFEQLYCFRLVFL